MEQPVEAGAVMKRHEAAPEETFVYYGEKRETCKACHDNWPCDAYQMAARLAVNEQQFAEVWDSYMNACRKLSQCDRDLAACRECTTNDIREQGWLLAVHNDYLQNGRRFTFYLFTHKDGRFVKGEGRTDAEALNLIRNWLSREKKEE